MKWILILLVSGWSQPVTVTYESLSACNSAVTIAKLDAKAAFCIPAPYEAKP